MCRRCPCEAGEIPETTHPERGEFFSLGILSGPRFHEPSLNSLNRGVPGHIHTYRGVGLVHTSLSPWGKRACGRGWIRPWSHFNPRQQATTTRNNLLRRLVHLRITNLPHHQRLLQPPRATVRPLARRNAKPPSLQTFSCRYNLYTGRRRITSPALSVCLMALSDRPRASIVLPV